MKYVVSIFLCCLCLSALAQGSEIFFGTQPGTVMDDDSLFSSTDSVRITEATATLPGVMPWYLMAAKRDSIINDNIKMLIHRRDSLNRVRRQLQLYHLGFENVRFSERIQLNNRYDSMLMGCDSAIIRWRLNKKISFFPARFSSHRQMMYFYGRNDVKSLQVLGNFGLFFSLDVRKVSLSGEAFSFYSPLGRISGSAFYELPWDLVKDTAGRLVADPASVRSYYQNTITPGRGGLFNLYHNIPFLVLNARSYTRAYMFLSSGVSLIPDRYRATNLSVLGNLMLGTKLYMDSNPFALFNNSTGKLRLGLGVHYFHDLTGYYSKVFYVGGKPLEADYVVVFQPNITVFLGYRTLFTMAFNFDSTGGLFENNFTNLGMNFSLK